MADIVVPELGESVMEATVGTWRKQSGDAVKAAETVVELETDKVNLEIAAEADGVLAEVLSPTGTAVHPGDVLGRIEPGSGSEPKEAQPTKPQPAEPASEEEAGDEAPADAVRATPDVRRLVAEHHLQLQDIPQTHGRGRVTRDDVEEYLQSRQPERPRPTPPPPSKPERPAPKPAASRLPEERVRLSRRRLTIASRLVAVQHESAMLTTFNEVDMSRVMDMRSRRKEEFESRHGVRLGFMSFFVKAAVGALKAFPQLNAELDGEELVLKYHYDIGIAVANANGLVVPVVRDADRLNFAGIEKAIRELSQKARDNTLALEDLRGGTFTITNGGVFGSLFSTPILNAPQVGILGMHQIQERPVAVDGQVEIRPMMYVALSYDHRVVDGSEAVQFLARIKEMVQNPETLLLDG